MFTQHSCASHRPQLTPGVPCTDGHIYYQTDFTGYDYTNVILSANATVQDCQALCCADPNCYAFTFANPQPLLSAQYSHGPAEGARLNIDNIA
jgi:hypothetical protein